MGGAANTIPMTRGFDRFLLAARSHNCPVLIRWIGLLPTDRYGWIPARPLSCMAAASPDFRLAAVAGRDQNSVLERATATRRRSLSRIIATANSDPDGTESRAQHNV
jgi:hypothetical protein